MLNFVALPVGAFSALCETFKVLLTDVKSARVIDTYRSQLCCPDEHVVPKRHDISFLSFFEIIAHLFHCLPKFINSGVAQGNNHDVAVEEGKNQPPNIIQVKISNFVNFVITFQMGLESGKLVMAPILSPLRSS